MIYELLIIQYHHSSWIVKIKTTESVNITNYNNLSKWLSGKNTDKLCCPVE